MNVHFDGRETSDLYHGELFRQGHYRVILCKDGIQWIIQRQDKAAGARWRSLSYCTARESLIRLWPALNCAIPLELAAFPDNVRGVCNG